MDRPFGQKYATRSVVLGHRGAVATSHPLATQIGLETLKRGGSAADAAIAANAALGLMEPTGCGIGGDLFAIVWGADNGRLAGLNGSGRSPKALTLEHFADHGLEQVPGRGPLSVSVPGAVDGWFTLHERFGRLPMPEILAPAIDYAKNGFPVSELIAHYWDLNARYFVEHAAYPGFRETYMPGGKVPAKGDIFRNPRLATTYEKIAAGGRDAINEGAIAPKIDYYKNQHGGVLRVLAVGDDLPDPGTAVEADTGNAARHRFKQGGLHLRRSHHMHFTQITNGAVKGPQSRRLNPVVVGQ